jgi:hypothetical protein
MKPQYLDYELLGPSYRFLSDEAVLTQAWRKSVEYIRRHNWYSDVLELDLTSIDTRRILDDCKKALSGDKWRDHKPAAMRIVPVPKSGAWTLTDEWGPTSEIRWRPLAHLTVRDQTLSTAAMICLAHLVETEQGDTRLPLTLKPRDFKRHRHTVSNYGNRLYCQWGVEGAKFQWGNSRTYREYFDDYRAFVARPNRVTQDYSTKQLAIVHIDIARFYDCIDRGVVVDKLRTLAIKKSQDTYDERFFECLSKIFAWSWHSSDSDVVKRCFGDIPTNGIPQGLVAGGFFANAYMLEFDRTIRRKLDDTPTAMGWELIDYCRYVDDMRLVIRFDETMDLKSLKTDVVHFLHQLLDKSAPGLRINPDKTDLLPLIARPSVVQVGGTMESLQTQVSGPLDPTSANQVLATLNALFPIAEQAVARIPLQENDGSTLLRELQSAELDVRPDTIERFAANRWRRVYRTLRSMTDQGNKGKGNELKALDEKARLFSRSLIRRWVSDPSNVRLLRVAFDVMPDLDNLNRYVLDLLLPHCFNPNAKKTLQFVAWYTISELLKAGATETGFVRDPDELSDSVDVKKYRTRLSEIAVECQENAGLIPWYLRQQSALFLLIHGRGIRLGAECDSHYRTTMNCLRGKWLPNPKQLRSELASVIRAVDLGGNRARLRDQVLETATSLPVKEKRAILRIFDGHFGGPEINTTTPLTLEPHSSFRLDVLLQQPTTPFVQENAALRLSERLLQLIVEDGREIDPKQVELTCDDFALLPDPSRSIGLKLKRVPLRPGERTQSSPRWCRPANRWRLALAMILTQAIRGTAISSKTSKVRELRYSPVRMRRNGILGSISTSRMLMGGPLVPISPWMEEFLMHLGQWPGFVPYPDLIDLEADFKPKDALNAVRLRLKEQERLFGKASNLPIYEVPIRFNQRRNKNAPFTAMLVQTALPKKEDFTAHGIDLNDKVYRRKHRRHLSSVLKLVLQTIETRETHTDSRRIDLIVLPELSVHPEDLHLIRLLISKTRAWVFCGIVFEKVKPSERTVNRGAWLIPTFRKDGTRHTRQLLRFDQGKHHLIKPEVDAGVSACRDCQWVLVGKGDDDQAAWRLSASICYDATDLQLVSDLRNVTDGFIVSALNQDVPTFDNMIAALHYHMYQHVVLVNSGQYGGSSVQAPYVKHFVKNRVHAHGSDQVVISICEMQLLDFRHGKVSPGDLERKTPPAGFSRGKSISQSAT